MARDVNLNQAVLEDLQALSADAQRAWFVLRLDPRIGLTGMGRIALPSVAKALDLSIEKTRKVLGELCQAEGGTGCEYDERAGLLWFRGAFAREPKSPTVLRAVLTELQRLPASPVVGRWLARYGQEERGGSRGDIESTAGNWEVKRRANLPEFLRLADDVRGVLVRQDRGPWMIVMRATDVLGLIRRLASPIS